MARSDLLLGLVKAGASGDRRLLRSVVEAIIAEERSKQHNVFADRLDRAISGIGNGVGHTTQSAQELPTSRGREFISEIRPERRLEDLFIPDVARLACEQLLEEQRRADLLRSHSLEPRHRVLLVGPPGNGKTSLAEAIAEALAVPFFVIRYDAIIGSFLGETATRLKRTFDYVRTTPCVIFFDEFDAIGKERGDRHETGEIKRVVSSLLMQIDDLPSYSVIIAATNHAELLDRAVWRRFQLRIELPVPSRKAMSAFIEQFFKRFDEPVGISTDALAKKLGPISFSEAEQFCLDLLRRYVLSMRERSLRDLLSEQLQIWLSRIGPNATSKEGVLDAGKTSSETSQP